MRQTEGEKREVNLVHRVHKKIFNHYATYNRATLNTARQEDPCSIPSMVPKPFHT